MIFANISFFVTAPAEAGFNTHTIVPVINGAALTELVAAYETDRAFEPAGGYGGLVLENLDYGPLDLYLTGQLAQDSYWAELGGIYVLGCECGEVDCWPLVCRVRADGANLSWEQFKQPHRAERDYSAFGPFVFEREQYRKAVTALLAAL